MSFASASFPLLVEGCLTNRERHLSDTVRDALTPLNCAAYDGLMRTVRGWRSVVLGGGAFIGFVGAGMTYWGILTHAVPQSIQGGTQY